jgi:hypothetical protein
MNPSTPEILVKNEHQTILRIVDGIPYKYPECLVPYSFVAIYVNDEVAYVRDAVNNRIIFENYRLTTIVRAVMDMIAPRGILC